MAQRQWLRWIAWAHDRRWGSTCAHSRPISKPRRSPARRRTHWAGWGRPLPREFGRRETDRSSAIAIPDKYSREPASSPRLRVEKLRTKRTDQGLHRIVSLAPPQTANAKLHRINEKHTDRSPPPSAPAHPENIPVLGQISLAGP